MLIPTKGVTVNNEDYGKYITNAKFGYHKLWGRGSGRNLAQSVTGSFSIFPKVTLSFRKLYQSEIETVLPSLNAQSQSVKYYDPDLKRDYTMSSYTGDVEYNQSKIGVIKGFDIAFISRNRRI